MNSREYQVECQYCEDGSVFVTARRFNGLEWEYFKQEWDCAECWGEGFLWEECISEEKKESMT